MANTVTFKIGSIETREVATKWGPKQVRDLIAEDGTKYQLGFDKSVVKVGDMVTCAVESGKYGATIVKGTLGAAVLGTMATPPEPYVASSNKSGRPFPVPNSSGEMAIIRQNALTNAVNAVDHWTNFGEVRPAPTLEAYVNSIIDVAYKFAEFSSGQREVKMAAKIKDRVAGSADLTKAIEAAVAEGGME